MRRTKSANMTIEEKRILRQVVLKYFECVHNKKNDGWSNREKQDAWERITAEVNAYPGVHPRDVLQFRKAWENMKRARRTSLDRERALKLLSQHPICLLANTDDEMFNPDDIEELDSHDSDWVYQNRLTKKTEALTTDAESHTSLPENIQDDESSLEFMIPHVEVSYDASPSSTGHEDAPSTEDLPDVNVSTNPNHPRPGFTKSTNGLCGTSVTYETESEAKVKRIKLLQEQDLEWHNVRMKREQEFQELRIEGLRAKIEREKQLDALRMETLHREKDLLEMRLKNEK